MSMLNARNARNARGLLNARSRAGAAPDDALAAALLTVREAILPPAALVAPDCRAAPGCPAPVERLLRLEPEFAGAVLLAAMQDVLTVQAESPRVTVGLRTGAALVEAVGPADGALAGQVAAVAGYADLRPERLAEIVAQADDLGGFFDAVTGVPGPATGLLLDLAADLATSVAQRIKLALAVPRPVTLSAAVQPILPTPGHGSFPSGHATQAFAMAAVLDDLTGGPDGTGPWQGPLWRLAARIAVNRTVAGLHYPLDSAFGAVLGVTLGRAILSCAGAGGVVPQRFDAVAWLTRGSAGGGEDFHAAALPGLFDAQPAPVALPEEPLLAALRTRARAEWAGRWR